jgi:two-component system sensor histidine kinase KdpD
MKTKSFSGEKQSYSRSVLVTVLFLSLVSLLSLALTPLIGYRAVGFIFLIGVVALGLFASPGQILLSAFLSAFVWNYFFIPPRFTIYIHAPEDIMMCITYLVVALTTGFLTHRIRRNEMIALKAKQLEESEKLHQAIFNSISHELKTPLTTIIGSATALQDVKAVHSQEARRELTLGIIEASSRLDRLIENLLDTSRLDSGRMTLNSDWHDVSDLISASLQRLGSLGKNHKFEVMLDKNLPLIVFDFSLMEHVLLNLLLNAVNYSSHGTVVKIRAQQAGDSCTLFVEDEGIGIAQEHAEKIFQKFYRIPGSPAGGTGLGLSIVRAIVESHGGEVWVEPRHASETGSRFVVKLKCNEIMIVSRSHNSENGVQKVEVTE